MARKKECKAKFDKKDNTGYDLDDYISRSKSETLTAEYYVKGVKGILEENIKDKYSGTKDKKKSETLDFLKKLQNLKLDKGVKTSLIKMKKLIDNFIKVLDKQQRSLKGKLLGHVSKFANEGAIKQLKKVSKQLEKYISDAKIFDGIIGDIKSKGYTLNELYFLVKMFKKEELDNDANYWKVIYDIARIGTELTDSGTFEEKGEKIDPIKKEAKNQIEKQIQKLEKDMKKLCGTEFSSEIEAIKLLMDNKQSAGVIVNSGDNRSIGNLYNLILKLNKYQSELSDKSQELLKEVYLSDQITCKPIWGELIS